ncbi:hypothetical protein LY78DRAFT_237546 [Colletotrichum sublineola]|nr:hypothetical protein LY78DRAFT_237546 [Colletotrichum sublineola]
MWSPRKFVKEKQRYECWVATHSVARSFYASTQLYATGYDLLAFLDPTVIHFPLIWPSTALITPASLITAFSLTLSFFFPRLTAPCSSHLVLGESARTLSLSTTPAFRLHPSRLRLLRSPTLPRTDAPTAYRPFSRKHRNPIGLASVSQPSAVPHFNFFCYRAPQFDISPYRTRFAPSLEHSCFLRLVRRAQTPTATANPRSRVPRPSLLSKHFHSTPNPFSPSHLHLLDSPRPAAPISLLNAIPVLRLELRETPEAPCPAYRRKSKPAPYASRLTPPASVRKTA